ncbi:hypothetical protein BSNK01_27120 [Bacillaceae bacterium]
MAEHFARLFDIFSRTKDAIRDFMAILQPTIDQARDEHERLYYHHLFEEEDHRLDRLQELLPKLEHFIRKEEAMDTQNREFIGLLQDLSLEKFGLHNFLEHLDLALFHFKGTPHEEQLQKMRDMTHEDYQNVKKILFLLNERFDGAAETAAGTPTDEKAHVTDSVKVARYADAATATKAAAQADNPAVTDDTGAKAPAAESERPSFRQRKRFTVGSLKQ